MIAALALAVVASGTSAPTYVVERLVYLNRSVTRVSVFRNGVAVLARRSPGEAEHVIRQPLSKVELQVIEQVVDESYRELERSGSANADAPGPGKVELRMAPPGRAPLQLRYSVTAAPSLALARVTQALDGLEATLAASRVTREDLSGWEPSPGDRVELEDGRIVEVLSVTPNPSGVMVVHVQVGGGPASFFVTDEELRRRAVRRVPR